MTLASRQARHAPGAVVRRPTAAIIGASAAGTVEYRRMTDAPDSPATGDLSVLDAWRVLAKPAPTLRARSYVALLAIIVLLNLSAIAVLVAASVTDLSLAMAVFLLHTTIIP